jgi:hypothetical protein
MIKEETELKLTFEELIVVSALMSGHRIGMVEKVDDNHWIMLEKLHSKIVKSLVKAADKELKNG